MTFHEKHFQKLCSGKCGRPRDLAYTRYCRECRNARSREKRPKHGELSPEARERANCRAYTNQMIRRGELVKGPCEDCGTTENIQPHHTDYTKPREVRWKCKACHQKNNHPERSPVCSDCGGVNDYADIGQAYCRACHAKHMREYRAEQKARKAELVARVEALRAEIEALRA